jgi:hypothetical protein
VKRINWFEFGFISICMLFIVAISLYHISYDGYLKLPESTWNTIWAIAENGFSLTLCALIVILTAGILRLTFKWVFIPYFILKLIYHISCYAKVYLLSETTWEYIWSIVLVLIIIASLTYCLILTRKSYVVKNMGL